MHAVACIVLELLSGQNIGTFELSIILVSGGFHSYIMSFANLS